ncbi:L-xylulose reductase-like [Euwallacea similis]|uniref:L-xylulose reductase-like n=1 Tax=Euwallacea similis TaxID=1736056 RepID=UPI00344BD2CB
MEINFNGKRTLVTGASQGIGRELVKKLVACGAKVVAVARNKELLEKLQKEVPSIEIFAADLADWKRTEEVLTQIGDIDLLVNNAALAILAPLTEAKEEDVNRIFAINVKAVINISKYVVTNLLARKVPGTIVNISSQASVVGLNNHTLYCASKGAVDAFTRAAAQEYGKYGIRFNNVNPTVILTDMGRLGWSDPKIAAPMLEKIPLRRFGEVDEVVNAIIFLLSDMSSMTTGSNLYVDGGFVAV